MDWLSTSVLLVVIAWLVGVALHYPAILRSMIRSHIDDWKRDLDGVGQKEYGFILDDIIIWTSMFCLIWPVIYLLVCLDWVTNLFQSHHARDS